ncbi:MAG: DNA polymerase III subunit delta' [Gammaproteobacteria bacterium]|nr:DNA polymerase III subunit delta' [Gammaproteobacteria bacterium]
MTQYPWQQAQQQLLERLQQQQRLPHALLLTGQAGMGKLEFAQAFAQQLLCSDTSQAAALLAAGNHPDYFIIEPAEEKTTIAVDQIRQLQTKLQQTAHVGNYQVAIIAPAEAMNIAASNALLKTLEEPAGNTLIILVSSHAQQLPATIRSRCQKLHFGPAQDEITTQWLQQQLTPEQDAALLLNLAQGAPLLAAAMAEPVLQNQRKQVFKGFANVITQQADPVAIAAEWQTYALAPVLSWLQTWLADIARCALSIELSVNNSAYQQAITKLTAKTTVQKAFAWYDKLLELKQQFIRVNQLNAQLALEDLLIGIYHDR